MTTRRPVCVHCGKSYGKRRTKDEVVRWDTPTRQSNTPGPRRQFTIEAIEPTVPPPPYVGNGIVVKESKPHLSIEDHRMVMRREIWDGKAWWGGYDPFCTLRCALDYARKAYARAAT
jgi:hypothetical protein